MRLRWLVASLILSVILVALDRLALEYFIYWRYPWSDTFMHFLGAAAIGTFAVGVIYTFRPIAYLALVAAIAIGWEVFEYLIRATTYGKGFTLDTSSDLLFDTLGALLIYAIARYTLWRSA